MTNWEFVGGMLTVAILVLLYSRFFFGCVFDAYFKAKLNYQKTLWKTIHQPIPEPGVNQHDQAR